MGVEALGRRRVGALGDGAASEPVVHEVGDEQEGLGGLERRVALGGHGGELEQRVDGAELDAGALVELAAPEPRR